MSVRRDPETGQFVAADGQAFDDVEVHNFNVGVGIPAADLAGNTTFSGESVGYEGVEVIDYDDIVDRNEMLRLLWAQHVLTVFANSTETADGTVVASVELSSSPSRSVAANVITDTDDIDGGPVQGRADSDDTLDVVGRALLGMAGAPFSDSATGVGGAGTEGKDSVVVTDIPERIALFHPRDELFMNGTFRTWNIDDAGVHASVHGQHVYGVLPA